MSTINMIESLIEELDSRDAARRLQARDWLIEMGPAATPALIKALSAPSERLRWEAAKALGEIRDPSAAGALVDAMEDEEAAVRWLAAKALIALGRGALVPVLRGVERCVDNFWLKTGTIHVLHTLVREGVAPEAAPVLEALEDIAPRVEAPVAAYHVLQQLLQKRAA